MPIIDARHLFPKAVDDPDEEIEVTMTKGQALAVMMAIDVLCTDYEECHDTPLLEDVYMELCDEVWPEIELDESGNSDDTDGSSS